MGIDIYVEWPAQTCRDRETLTGGVPAAAGNLRETYRGNPYASYFFVAEAFSGIMHKAKIPARRLRERLPQTLERVNGNGRDTALAAQFVAFVEFCERMEVETGEPACVCVRPVF